MPETISKNKIFLFALSFILMAEILSFLGYYFPALNQFIFFLIIIIVAAISLEKPALGLAIALTELFIGSFGYLFFYETGQANLSIRLALWLVILAVWLGKTLIDLIKLKKIPDFLINWRQFMPFFILWFFILAAVLRGISNHHPLNNLFFDFNNWLYFLLVFPIFSAFKDKADLKILATAFFASLVWLSLKTLALGYFFSHNFSYFALDLYRWIRESGLGEITAVSAGFSRIFLQSQIFVLIGYFLSLCLLLENLQKKKTAAERTELRKIKRRTGLYLALAALFLAAIIISFSRSFWVGLIAGGLFLWLAAWFKFKIGLKTFLNFNWLIFLSIVLGLVISFSVIKFPLARVSGSFDPATMLGQRISQLNGEAGASSRLRLLPVLWQEIASRPLSGKGFGATVTYRTDDPRIKKSGSGGLYTTYAFEWGWLDIWLKLGAFGLLAYFFFIGKIIYDSWKINSFLSLAVSTGLVVLSAVNIFSPYANHPLGIGFVILAFFIIENFKTNKNPWLVD